MARIHNFKISVTGYYEQGKDNLFPDLYGCPDPACLFSGRLSKNGFYSRNAIWFTGIYRIVIQRYRCPICDKSDSTFPSFLLPRFQYSLLLIFYCLKALAIARSTLIRVAASAHEGLSYQLVRVYRSRFVLPWGHFRSVNRHLVWRNQGIRHRSPNIPTEAAYAHVKPCNFI